MACRAAMASPVCQTLAFFVFLAIVRRPVGGPSHVAERAVDSSAGKGGALAATIADTLGLSAGNASCKRGRGHRPTRCTSQGRLRVVVLLQPVIRRQNTGRAAKQRGGSRSLVPTALRAAAIAIKVAAPRLLLPAL